MKQDEERKEETCKEVLDEIITRTTFDQFYSMPLPPTKDEEWKPLIPSFHPLLQPTLKWNKELAQSKEWEPRFLQDYFDSTTRWGKFELEIKREIVDEDGSWIIHFNNPYPFNEPIEGSDTMPSLYPSPSSLPPTRSYCKVPKRYQKFYSCGNWNDKEEQWKDTYMNKN
jgi:hypothetical protein